MRIYVYRRKSLKRIEAIYNIKMLNNGSVAYQAAD